MTSSIEDYGVPIVKAEYGSRAVGVSTDASDHDYMGIFVGHPQFVTGLDTVETLQFNTAGQSQRSTADDTDETWYELRKWARLAAAGNPNAVGMLFLPTNEYNTAWTHIRFDSEAFLSKEAGRRYLGYSRGQRAALLGERNKRTNRPELVETHGWDTKFGYHMLRTLLHGIELMDFGRVSYPITGVPVEILKDVRAGRVSKADGLEMAQDLEETLAIAISTSHLSDTADRARINTLLHDIYSMQWRSTQWEATL